LLYHPGEVVRTDHSQAVIEGRDIDPIGNAAQHTTGARQVESTSRGRGHDLLECLAQDGESFGIPSRTKRLPTLLDGK
jgi:hypothetical protein